MRTVNGVVVKAPAQRQAVAEGAQGTARAGAREVETGVAVGRVSQGPRAGADGVEVAAGGGQRLPGPWRSAGRSCPMQRW